MDDEERKLLLAMKDHIFFELISDLWSETDKIMATLAGLKNNTLERLPQSESEVEESCNSIVINLGKITLTLETGMNEIHEIIDRLNEDDPDT